MNLMMCPTCNKLVAIEDEWDEDLSHDEVRLPVYHIIVLACGHQIDWELKHERSEP